MQWVVLQLWRKEVLTVLGTFDSIEEAINYKDKISRNSWYEHEVRQILSVTEKVG